MSVLTINLNFCVQEEVKLQYLDTNKVIINNKCLKYFFFFTKTHRQSFFFLAHL